MGNVLSFIVFIFKREVNYRHKKNKRLKFLNRGLNVYVLILWNVQYMVGKSLAETKSVSLIDDKKHYATNIAENTRI